MQELNWPEAITLCVMFTSFTGMMWALFGSINITINKK